MAAAFKEGMHTIDEAMKELRELGFLHLIARRGEDGKMSGHHWYWFRKAISREEFKKFHRKGGFPEVGESGRSEKPGGIRRLIHKKTNIKKEEREREGAAPPNPPRPPKSESRKKVERRPHVSTTDEEHKKLADEHGEKKRDAAYEVLGDWKEDTPRSKWKKSDYRSLLRWVFDAMDEKKGKRGGSKRSNSNECLSDEAKGQYDGKF